MRAATRYAFAWNGYFFASGDRLAGVSTGGSFTPGAGGFALNAGTSSAIAYCGAAQTGTDMLASNTVPSTTRTGFMLHIVVCGSKTTQPLPSAVRLRSVFGFTAYASRAISNIWRSCIELPNTASGRTLARFSAAALCSSVGTARISAVATPFAHANSTPSTRFAAIPNGTNPSRTTHEAVELTSQISQPASCTR